VEDKRRITRMANSQECLERETRKGGNEGVRTKFRKQTAAKRGGDVRSTGAPFEKHAPREREGTGLLSNLEGVTGPHSGCGFLELPTPKTWNIRKEKGDGVACLRKRRPERLVKEGGTA